MSKVIISVIIPARDAILSIGRVVSNALRYADRICVCDYGSTDGTQDEAARMGAEVHNTGKMDAGDALRWAYSNLGIADGWVLVLRPEDFLTDRAVEQLRDYLGEQPHDVTACSMVQRYYFMHRWMKHARMYPSIHIKVMRAGHMYVSKPWLEDFRLKCDEKCVSLPLEYVHDNPKSLSDWIERKNDYTDRLAVEVIYHELELYKIHDTIPADMQIPRHNTYYDFPMYVKTMASFFYHYFLLGGVLDGKEGLIYHFFRCFWHRALAYAKVAWIYRMNLRSVPRVIEYVRDTYHFDLTK